MQTQNSAAPVPKVANPAIFSLATTLLILGAKQAGIQIEPETAAAIVGFGAAIVGWFSPRK